jgi:Fe-S-cluster-containing hydrogenase component 2
VNYYGPNRHFGEVGIMAEIPQFAALVPDARARRRTATCVALDDVELVRIDKRDFLEMLQRFRKLLDRFASTARELLAPRERVEPDPVETKTLTEFASQGLYNAQRLLAIDLDACTRCDECAKACADTHGGVTRLIRDGLRLGQWLVASACRSCSDPYCLVGCPVDAIHRHGQRKEIVIENHCIGCGLCANHCPYGNINLHGIEQVRPDPSRPGKTYKIIQQQATTCDLCTNVVGPDATVSCVHACPHHAAFRMSGEELLRAAKE